MENNRFMRPPEACELLKVSRRTLTNLLKRPGFPQPMRLQGTHLVRYDREKLEAFLAGEAAETRADGVKS